MDYTKFIRAEDVKQLETNWTEQLPRKGTSKEIDYKPVVKVFNPLGSATILVTEKEPGSGLSFGLVDLGFGTPELGYLDLEEILSVELPGGFRMEQDTLFTATQTIGQYASEARKLQYLRHNC